LHIIAATHKQAVSCSKHVTVVARAAHTHANQLANSGTMPIPDGLSRISLNSVLNLLASFVVRPTAEQA
jgi:hypothetical protein